MGNEKDTSEKLTVKKSEDFSEWYNQIVQKAGLADYAPISGCMIIRPYGYAIWENMKEWFDCKIKSTGVQNAYFPMFIPESFLKKESEHFEGFVPEVAWIEKKDENEERYALRPTSETIMYDAYSKWIRSWRDLPLRLNQWCNIVRWEVKATRLFLRTREFLWQEGHTAHASLEEAAKETDLRANQYKELMETQLAVPVFKGKKSRSETFPGALYTIALEALMPDGKALQMGTSHNLGQHFAKVFGITFQDKDKQEKHVFQTSWGITTRMIGAVAMVHGDDKGLVVPPNIAPTQVVIVPIYKNETKKAVLKEAERVEVNLCGKFRVHLDDREAYSPGWKFNDWEMKGIPIRIEIGPNDMKKKQVTLVRRDTGTKSSVKTRALEKTVGDALKKIQKNLFEKAKKKADSKTKAASDLETLDKYINSKNMVKAYWCGCEKCEEKIKDRTGATMRTIIDEDSKQSKCVSCAKPSKTTVYFAKAY